MISGEFSLFCTVVNNTLHGVWISVVFTYYDEIEFYLIAAYHMAAFAASLLVIRRLGPAEARLPLPKAAGIGAAAGVLCFAMLVVLSQMRKFNLLGQWNASTLGVMLTGSWALVWCAFWSWEAMRRKPSV